MSDIVTRLRRHADKAVGHWEDYANATDSIVRDAADEIERLRLALADVVSPLENLRRYAAARGKTLNGSAYSIVNNLGFVQDIAKEALGESAPSPAPNTPCPCTLIEQDEDCPVGYPSMICGICKGKGHATQEQITALACEMIKIASDVGEPEDPFAAWETIDLIKSQHGQRRKTVEELKFALFSSDMTIKDRADQAARLALAASEGSADA